jgi:rhodanese-related sulfurtransferase
VKLISVAELREQHGRQPEHIRCVDVRSPSEYAAGHIPGALNIPLEQVEARLADIEPGLPTVLICKGGTRALLAAGLLAPFFDRLAVLDGGTMAWAKTGLPLVACTKTRWSLERQVRLAAGVLILLGATLTISLAPYWVYLCGFVGLGLTFAGLTDFCPMGMLLARLPWNRPRQRPQDSGRSRASAEPGASAVH